MCSAMSAMGIGGWLSMPGGESRPRQRGLVTGGPARWLGAGVLYGVSLHGRAAVRGGQGRGVQGALAGSARRRSLEAVAPG